MADILMKGIDVSQYQTNVDYNKVKAAGYDFVIIRAGYGKYVKQKDTQFETHYKNAKAAGLHIGAYWYNYAKTPADAKIEADVFKTIIQGKQFDMPVYYDIEEQSVFATGADNVDKIANTFCKEMEAAGYWCGIYGGQYLGESLLSATTRERYAFWLAQYLKNPRYKGTYGMWQFSVAGGKSGDNPSGIPSVPGVSGQCDLDYCYVDYPTKIKEKKLNGYQDGTNDVPEPTPEPVPSNDFKPRLTKPEKGNKYYNTISNGGYSTAIVGKPTDKDCNVLSNCVGYAFGRFNEIIGKNTCNYLKPVNAEDFVDVALSQGLTVSKEPSLGAVICWAKGKTHNSADGAGHVAVVEQINADGSIVTSESGYNCSNPFWTQKRTKGNGNWGQSTAYTFLGFIENPAVKKQPEPENKAPYPVPTRSLREGDTGEDVLWLQYYLMELQHYNDELDGRFDTYTLGGLLAWQLHNGLEVDGVCGPATRNSLMNALQ